MKTARQGARSAELHAPWRAEVYVRGSLEDGGLEEGAGVQIQLLLANDVHSPTVLRANMQPRNFPEWDEAFGVTETDGMYLPPEKRISIW